MSRKPEPIIHDIFQHLLVHYIDKYYKLRAEEPGIKHNPISHLALATLVEQEYKADLEEHPEWNTEEKQGAFRKHIDFLTKVFSKHKEQCDRQARMEEFKEALVRRPRIIIY